MTLTLVERTPATMRDLLEFRMGDRMGKTLEATDLSVAAIADYLGVARQTVGAWINNRTVPTRQTVLLWSEIFGVSVQWLETGIWTEDEERVHAEMQNLVHPPGLEPGTH